VRGRGASATPLNTRVLPMPHGRPAPPALGSQVERTAELADLSARPTRLQSWCEDLPGGREYTPLAEATGQVEQRLGNPRMRGSMCQPGEQPDPVTNWLRMKVDVIAGPQLPARSFAIPRARLVSGET